MSRVLATAAGGIVGKALGGGDASADLADAPRRAASCSRAAPGTAGRGFGDSAFGPAFDVASGTTGIRVAGLDGTLDPADAPIAVIERRVAARIMPRP